MSGEFSQNDLHFQGSQNFDRGCLGPKITTAQQNEQLSHMGKLALRMSG